MPKQYRGLIAPFFLTLFSFLLFGCGEHNLKNALFRFRTESKQLVNVEAKCQSKVQSNYLPKLEEIDALFVRNFELKKKRKLEHEIERPLFQSYSLYQPLIVSQKLIDERIQKIENSIQLIEKDQTVAMSDFAPELLDIRSHILRMQFNDCRQSELKEKSADDPRAFLFLQDYCSSKDCYRESLLDPQKRANVKKNLEEMCRQINSKESCALSMEINGRKKVLDEFLIATKSRYLAQKYVQFYTLKKEALKNKFFCQKDNLKTRIGIQISSSGDKSAAELGQIIQWIKAKWDNDLLVFDFEIVDTTKDSIKNNKRALTINWIEGPVSYVDWGKPNVINLSNGLLTGQLSLVVAHEFGHYVGFPDCYVEFLNENSEYIYFELPSKKNIMCSLNTGHMVPEYYREQIEQNLCQF